MPISELIVRQVYRDLLRREPDDEGLSYWMAHCDGDNELRTHVMHSPEFAAVMIASRSGAAHGASRQIDPGGTASFIALAAFVALYAWLGLEVWVYLPPDLGWLSRALVAAASPAYVLVGLGGSLIACALVTEAAWSLFR